MQLYKNRKNKIILTIVILLFLFTISFYIFHAKTNSYFANNLKSELPNPDGKILIIWYTGIGKKNTISQLKLAGTNLQMKYLLK